MRPIAWRDGALELLDQTRLPAEEAWLRCTEVEQVADAIRRLAVRGAPSIGVAAAYGLAIGMGAGAGGAAPAAPAERFEAVSDLLAATRPTAVNLRWALERGRAVFASSAPEDAGPALLELAHSVAREQEAADRAMGEHGVELFGRGERVLTHCNTGALATSGSGSAGGVIGAAWGAGGVSEVWVDETRPLMQGARLTAWELGRLGVPYRLVTDGSVGTLMSRGLVDRVVVGADRIAANGDVANKIGTYTVAVVAHHHGVPFHVAAPLSTIDPATLTGAHIPIEERDPGEVTSIGGAAVAPAGASAANWAFDVTPAALVASIVTEAGILRPPYEEAIASVLER